MARRHRGRRQAAERIAPLTLAHRLFIVSSTGMNASKLDLVEGGPLTSLAERRTQLGLQHLANHHPEGLGAERVRLERRAAWLSGIVRAA